jgi:hypothetical protein
MAAETGCLRIVRMLADHGADTRSRETQRRGSTQVRSTNEKLTGLAQYFGASFDRPLIGMFSQFFGPACAVWANPVNFSSPWVKSCVFIPVRTSRSTSDRK